MAVANGFNEAIKGIEKQIQSVATKIGSDWKKLGRRLEIEECVIQGIQEDNTTTEERAFQVLNKWLQINGSRGATSSVLYKALIDIGRTLIAEKLIVPEPDTEPSRETKSRPFSEILPRCTSIVMLLPRSDTDSAVVLTRYRNSSRISTTTSPPISTTTSPPISTTPSPPISTTSSSPISTTTSSRPLTSPEMTCTEFNNTEQVGEPRRIRTCCPDCGNCFELQIGVSEISLVWNCNQSNPDPMLHERTANNQDGLHDTKL